LSSPTPASVRSKHRAPIDSPSDGTAKEEVGVMRRHDSEMGNVVSPGTKADGAQATWARLDEEWVCYLTTVGRRTGRQHTIEVWFAIHDRTHYMLSGGAGRSDWVRNLVKTPQVTVCIASRRFTGRARIVTDPAEDRLARELVPAKYGPSYGGDLSGWRERALPVAVDLAPPDEA
jgi:deazaflavin-dependent oxidoreductase (nitroreductase family)